MSLLNLTSDGLPNILVVVYSILATSRKAWRRDELIAHIAPAEVVKDNRLARTTVNRWIELGLLKMDPDTEALSLAEEPGVSLDSEQGVVKAVRIAARRVALSEDNSGDLWAKEESRAADLSRSVAWLLAQDVYRTGNQSLFSVANAQVAGTGAVIMQNEARATGLKVWAYFFGFVRHAGNTDIDPTVAIADVLDQCIPRGAEMPAKQFVEALAHALPVLDGGVYRRAVELRLGAGALPTLQPDQLSMSLSRALMCLRVNKTLQLTNRADVGTSIVLTGRNGLRSDQRFTWVRRAE
jgi:hypothetical protein